MAKSPRIYEAAAILISFGLFLFLLLPVGVYDYCPHTWTLVLGARDLIEEGEFPLAGETIAIGGHYGPLLIFLNAIPLLFWRHIYSPYIFLFILHALTPYLVYRIGRRIQDEQVGLLAALFFVLLFPYSIACKILWYKSYICFFSTFFLSSLLAVSAQQKKASTSSAASLVAFPLLCFSLSALLQTHFVCFSALPVFALVFLVRRNALRPGVLLTGLAILFITFSPYLIFLYQDGFHDISWLSDFFLGGESGPGATPGWTAAPFMDAVKILHLVGNLLTKPLGDLLPANDPTWMNRMGTLFFILAMAYLIVLIVRQKKRYPGKAFDYFLLLIIIVLGFLPIMFMFHWIRAGDNHIMGYLPAPTCVVLAMFVRRISRIRFMYTLIVLLMLGSAGSLLLKKGLNEAGTANWFYPPLKQGISILKAMDDRYDFDINEHAGRIDFYEMPSMSWVEYRFIHSMVETSVMRPGGESVGEKRFLIGAGDAIPWDRVEGEAILEVNGFNIAMYSPRIDHQLWNYICFEGEEEYPGERARANWTKIDRFPIKLYDGSILNSPETGDHCVVQGVIDGTGAESVRLVIITYAFDVRAIRVNGVRAKSPDLERELSLVDYITRDMTYTLEIGPYLNSGDNSVLISGRMLGDWRIAASSNIFSIYEVSFRSPDNG